MKAADRGWAFSAGLLFFFALATLATAGEAPGKKGEDGSKPAVDESRYKVIKYINPFSPFPPKEPVKPKPTREPVKRKPPVKVKVLPDNLHFTGVTYDNGRKAYSAMVEVDGSRTKFLNPGEKVGVWEVVKVDMDDLTVKGKDGKTRILPLGTAFHDGVTVLWKTEGGGSVSTPKSAPAPPSKSSGGSKLKIDDAKRREIIERLKKKRRDAQKKKGR